MSAVAGAVSYDMTQDVMDEWADLSGDFNPLHVSPDYAAGTAFGGTIAHGHFSLAVIEGLLLETVGDSWLEGGLLRELKFTSPVRPNSTYQAQVRAAVEFDGYRIEVTDAATGTLCIRGEAVISKDDLW